MVVRGREGRGRVGGGGMRRGSGEQGRVRNSTYRKQLISGRDDL